MYWDKTMSLVYAVMAYLKINADYVVISRCSSVLLSAPIKLQLSVFQLSSFTHDHPLTSFSVIWSPTDTALNSLKHDDLTPTVLQLSKFPENQGSRSLEHVGIYDATCNLSIIPAGTQMPCQVLNIITHISSPTAQSFQYIIYPTFLHRYFVYTARPWRWRHYSLQNTRNYLPRSRV